MILKYYKDLRKLNYKLSALVPLWFGFVCHEDIKTQIRNSFMEVQNKMDFKK